MADAITTAPRPALLLSLRPTNRPSLTSARGIALTGKLSAKKLLRSLSFALESHFHRMSAEWQFLFTLNERLRPLRDPVRIQESAIGLIREHLQVSRVGYALIDGDDFVIIRSCYDSDPPVVGRSPLAIFG